MNQRTDSRKKNLVRNVTKPPKDGSGWLLSHSRRRSRLSSNKTGPTSRAIACRRETSKSGGPRKIKARSGRVSALRPFRSVRPQFSNGGRLDVCGLAGRACGRRRAKDPAALRRQLRLVSDHAGGDPIDVGDFGSAKAKCIAAAILLLLRRVGVTGLWQHRQRKRRGKRCRE